MTGGEEDATGSLSYPDDMAGSRSTEDTVLTDQQLLDAVCGTDLGDLLGDLGVPETTVTTNDEESTLGALRNRLEDAGDERLGVVLLLEDLDLLTKTRTGNGQLCILFKASNLAIDGVSLNGNSKSSGTS